MSPIPRHICTGSIAALLAASVWLPTPVRAAIVYWDTDGTAPGAGGGTMPVGTWNASNAFWNPLADGTGTTNLWQAGDIAIFSAGSTATGAYTVTIIGTQTIGGLVFEDGTVTLAGGTLQLGADSDFFVGNALAARIQSTLSGSSALRKTGLGSLRLEGINSAFTGLLTVTNGVLSISSEAALGTGSAPVTVTGTATRGQGGGQLAVDGAAAGGITINRELFLSGGGPSGDSAALLSAGGNTFTNLTTGTTSATRIFSTGGTSIVTSLNAGAGQTTQFGGAGNWIVSGVLLSGQGGSLLEKAGAGGMILTGANVIENEVRSSGGSLRIDSGLGLPILSPNAGVLELRTDTAASFAETRMIARGSSTVFADRLVDSTAGLLNQTLAFSDSSFANAGATISYASRNGYGITLTGAGGSTGNITFPDGNTTLNTSPTSTATATALAMSGLLTINGNLSYTSNTTRTFTVTGHGDVVITGDFLGTGGVHQLIKGSATVGNGTLTLLGTSSTYTGGTQVNSGTLVVRQLTATGNGALSLGSLSTGVGALNYLGAADTGAGETNAKVFISPGTNAVGGILLASQAGSAPTALTLTGSFAATGTSTRTIYLGGTNTLDNTFSGLIQNSGTNVTSLAKIGPGTWVYSPATSAYASAVSGVTTTADSGANTNKLTVSSVAGLVPGQVVTGTGVPADSVVTAVDAGTNTVTISNNIATSITSGTTLSFTAVSSFTGGVTVAGGTLKFKPTATSGNGSDLIGGSLTFTADSSTGLNLTQNQFAGGTFEYVGVNNAASSESLGSLIPTAGAGTVKVTPTGTGSAALTFSSLGSRQAGATLNFAAPPTGGTFSFTAGPAGTNGILGGWATFNGVDWVTSGTSAARYTSYTTGLPTSGGSASINYHNTSSVTTTAAQTINSLKLSGSQTITLGGTLSLTTNGVLFDNSTGAATITGSQLGANNVEVIVTINGSTPANALTINSVIGGGTGSLTKAGTGTLILGGANAYTGTVTINEGTLRIATGGAVGGTNVNLVIRQGATFDLGGVNIGTSPTSGGANGLSGAGTITNSAASGTALLRVGNNSAATVFSGLIEDGPTAKIELAKGGGGTLSLTGVNTFTGPMTIAAGILQATTLADIGVPSSIGAGVSGSNAGSLVFAGGTLRYTGANNTSATSVIVQATSTPSVSINRLFTLAGNGTIESSGTFGNNVGASGVPNNAALVFNNTAAIAFSGTGSRQLTFGGTSISDNEFRPRLTNNGTSALSVVKTGVGLWILNPDAATPNTYTGTTRIDDGALQAVDGIGLPTNSNLTLNGGVFQSTGTFSRATGNGFGQVQVSGAAGGFSAATGKLKVMLNAGAALTWGDPFFDPTTLILNSTSALAEVELTNAIDFSAQQRTVQVNDNAATALDFATLSGVLSNGGLTKTGAGTLFLTNPNNTYDFGTTLSAGSLVVSVVGNGASTASSLGVGSGAVNFNGGTLTYVGTGETTDRLFQMTGGTNIDASGAGPLVLTNLVNSTSSNKTLTLRGFSTDVNEVRSVLQNNGTGVLSVTKADSGIWILSQANSYTGNTLIDGGSIGIGHDSAFGTSPLVRLTNASFFAAGADRSIANPVLFRGNATEGVFGEYSLTIGGAVTFGDNSGSTTVNNFIAAGKVLTINGTVTNADSGSNRTLTFSGSGTTIINGVIQNNQTDTSRASSITYSGTGLLVLNGANTYTGATTPTNANGAIQAADAVQKGAFTTASTPNGGTTLTLGSTSGLSMGQAVYGPNIPAGTTIASIDSGTTLTLSAATTGTLASGEAVGFGAAVGTPGFGLTGLTNLTLGGGVFQTSGTFNRALGTGPGAVQWNGSGGFAAIGGGLTLDFPVAGPLVWGGGTPGPGANSATANFITGGSTLVFGSTSATAEVNWIDALDLNNTGSAQTRTIQVNDNPAVTTDFLRIGSVAGSLTQSGTGTTSITKTGAGTLIIDAAGANGSNSFGGTITVNGGTLILNGTPLAPAANAGALTMTPSATGTNLVLASGVTLVRQGTFTANANSFAGGITISGGGAIHLNAVFPANGNPLATRTYIVGDNPQVTDDVVISVPLVNGNASAITNFYRQGAGRLVLTAVNDWVGALSHFRGTTVIDYAGSTAGRLSDVGDIEMRGGTLILKGNATGAVNELVGNLSPGGSNLGPYGGNYNGTTMTFNPPNPSPAGADPNSAGSLLGTTAPQGAQSVIQLQPQGSQMLTLTFSGFIRNPGGGITLLQTTDPVRGTFRTTQSGDASDGSLLATNVLIDGRWVRNDGTGKLARYFGTVQPDRGQWVAGKSYELTSAPTGTLGTNEVAGLIFAPASAGTLTLDLNNVVRSLTLTKGGLLVAPESNAGLIHVTGGKLLTVIPYRSAPGADLLLQNFSSGVLKVSSNLGHSDAPQGNTELITIAGPGTVELAGKSASMLTYFGAALLRGAVKVLGGATLRVSGGDAISDYVQLDLGSIGDVGGSFQLNGASEAIGGILNAPNANQGVGGGSIDLGSGGVLTLNQNLAATYTGTLTGTGALIKQGNATLTSNGSELAFNGTLNVTGGLLDLTGALTHGLTGNVTSILLRGGEIRGEHNSGGLAAINKLPDNATFTLDGTTGFGLRITSNTSGRSEAIKAVIIGSGANTITVDAAANTSQLTLNLTQATNALTRSADRGTLLVRGDNLGGGTSGSLNNSARILLGSGTAGLGLIGGTGSTPSSYPILPWALGNTGDGATANAPGNTFVTYGPNGLRPLNTASEYATSYAAAGSTDNLSINSDQTGLTGKTINALRFDTTGSAVTMSGSGNLTVNSGAILVSAGSGTNGATLGGFSNILPGSTNELVISVTSSNASAANAIFDITTAIANGFGSTAVTKTGDGTLRLSSGSTFSGGLTLNQGVVEFSTSPTALGSGAIRLAGGTLKYTGSSNVTLTQPIQLLGASSYYTPTGTGAAGNALSRGSVIDTGTLGNVTMPGPSGAGGIVKLGTSNLSFNSAASYTGTTAILQGTASFTFPLTTSGLFLVPENLPGPTATNNTITVNITSTLNVNQLIVGGVFTAASSQNGSAFLTVGNMSSHPAVTIGNGSGDSFLLVGYHDEGAANGAASTTTAGTLNLEQASSVTINVSRIFIGQNKGAGSGRTDGDMRMATGSGSTNNVTAGYMVVGSSPGPDSTGGGGIVSQVVLGSGQNNFNVDSLIVGGQNSNGKITLSPGGTFTLRDRGGIGGTDVYLGDNDDITNTTQTANNTTLDTTSGTIDARINLLVIGRHGGNTATTSTTGGGAGALRFGQLLNPADTSLIEAQTVQLAQISTRGVTNTGIGGTPDNSDKTLAEITQDNGTFRFGDLSKGGGRVVYNWNQGTIANLPGQDAVNHNVFISNSAAGAAQHFVSVSAGRTMTFESNAGFDGNAEITKVGPGTLVLKGASSYGGGTYIEEGRLLANNGSGFATGSGIVDVKSGAELGGSGSVGGLASIYAGGRLSPGAAPGAIGELKIGSPSSPADLILEAGSILKLEIRTGGIKTGDLLTIEGGLFVDFDPIFGISDPDGNPNTTATLEITDLLPVKLANGPVLNLITTTTGWDGGGLFKYNDPILGEQLITDYVAGNPNSGTLFYIGGYGYKLDYNAGTGGNLVQLIAVPEPGALASLIGGMGMLLGLQRFRRWSAKR